MTSAKDARRSPEARAKRREQGKRRRHRLFAKAREIYAELLVKLGGRCVQCGDTGQLSPLTVDHVNGQTWGHRHSVLRMDARVKRYLEEFMRGVPLQVLCKNCNSAKGRPELPEAPF